jgi:hypothetical protein
MPVAHKDNRPLSNPSCSQLVHELSHSAPQWQTLALHPHALSTSWQHLTYRDKSTGKELHVLCCMT